MESEISMLNHKLQSKRSSIKNNKRKNPSIDLRQLQQSLEINYSSRGTPLSAVCEQNTHYTLKGHTRNTKKQDASPVTQTKTNFNCRSKSIDKIQLAVDISQSQKYKLSRNMETIKRSLDASTKHIKSKPNMFRQERESFQQSK